MAELYRSACQQVFAQPHLLRAIFESLLYTSANRDLKHKLRGDDLAKYFYDRRVYEPTFEVDQSQLSTLAVCARVCHAWFLEAVPLLWAHRSEFNWDSLETFLEPIEPARLQLYADHVQRASLWLGVESDGAPPPPPTMPDPVLGGLRFPRLLGLRAMMRGYGDYIPQEALPNLAWVHLDPYYEYEGDDGPEVWGVAAEAWPILLNQIAEKCPLLRRIQLQDRTRIARDMLPRLAAKRPDIVFEGEGYIEFD